MFSRREGRCCITATRRSSNAPLNPPVVSFAASSNNSPVCPANCPRIPPRKLKKEIKPTFQKNCFGCHDATKLRKAEARQALAEKHLASVQAALPALEARIA